MITVGIPPSPAESLRLMAALEKVLSIRFEERRSGDDVGIDAWILPDSDLSSLHRYTNGRCHCYISVRNDQLGHCGEHPAIEFSRHPALPSPLNGRQIKTDEAITLKALPLIEENCSVLASKAGKPIWVAREFGEHQHHYVSLSIPELQEGEPLFSYFHGRRFLHLLPLLTFLRGLSEEHGWEPPPLQACFMFDDPNLHWPTYGYIDFGAVLKSSRENNYHASFATIPLDAWYVHKPTAAMFRENTDRISLLIHGNDHTSQELARKSSIEECDRILQQALMRISRYERRSGVNISKVMAPPHGACNEMFLTRMARLGFEAASISKGSLRHYNKEAPWLLTLGMSPAETIAGLTVFPRFPLSGDCRNSILVAALLHQPIIPMGHHLDVSDGLGVLAELSDFINSLGDVRWGSMQDIARSHYARQIKGNMLLVRMLTKKIEVSVPEGIVQIIVNQRKLQEDEHLSWAWQVKGGSDTKRTTIGSGEPISVRPGDKVDIMREHAENPARDALTARKRSIWPVVRRQLTEARDRITPAMRSISKPVK